MNWIQRSLLAMLFLTFLSGNARSDTGYLPLDSTGIQWVSGLTWEQIKKKAHDENKYIFMDCFATWCKPCKVMDQQIYPDDTVGRVMNKGFICVKVQMDSTKDDSDNIKSWYSMVKIIKKEFSVDAMPTLLFFAPTGHVVHKEVGNKNLKQFLSLVFDATNPEKQYYTLLDKYKRGVLDYQLMPGLAKMARSLGEKQISSQIARDYVVGYLEKDEARFYSKENQRFIYSFYQVLRSTDRLFSIYMQQPNRMDTLLGERGDSRMIVDYIISVEEINSEITRAKIENRELPWRIIEAKIKGKYGREYAKRNVITARVNYYKAEKDWRKYAKYLVRKIEIEIRESAPKYKPALRNITLNINAWEIFLYSNSKSDLKKALKWSEEALRLINPTSFNVGAYMDTRANLLYKLGKIKQAIQQQEEALKRITADAEKFGFIKSSVEECRTTLNAMQNSAPTHLKSGAIWTKMLRK